MEISLDKKKKSLLKGYNMLLYFAGSMIMNEPVEECIVDFWQRGILKTLPVGRNKNHSEFLGQHHIAGKYHGSAYPDRGIY